MAAHKGQFKKGGGRVGGGTHRKSAKRASGGTSIVVVDRGAPTHKRRAHHVTKRVSSQPKRKGKRRHGKGGAGSIGWGKLLGTGIVLANVAGTNNGPLGSTVYDWVGKIPGSKTFGQTATAGLVLGGIHRFTRFGGRFRPLLHAAGIVGIVAAAIKIGEAGTSFKWLGGYGRDSAFDVG